MLNVKEVFTFFVQIKTWAWINRKCRNFSFTYSKLCLNP